MSAAVDVNCYGHNNTVSEGRGGSKSKNVTLGHLAISKLMLDTPGGNSHIKGTGVLVVPRRVFSLKRSTAEVLEEPFRILSRKNMTGDTVFF